LPATRWVTGDIADPALHDRLFAEPVETIFHLCRHRQRRGRSGLRARQAREPRRDDRAARALPRTRLRRADRCRVSSTPARSPCSAARFRRASTIRRAPHPTLSYGAHKRACELLIDDCTRRGFIDGRALRLSAVVVRPPLANGALSGFNSDLIREPLAGRGYVCRSRRKRRSGSSRCGMRSAT
jgi:nucleoside-diphosphate-sugar epimerase